jgi:hypothetical protein
MIPASLAKFDAPLSPEERETLVADLAGAIRKRGMETPAFFLLETHRPLAFLASQSALALTPILAPILGLERLEKTVRLLNDPAALNALLERIAEDAQMSETTKTPEGNQA